MIKKILVYVTVSSSLFFLISCAANKAVSNVSFDMRLVNHVDSIFALGNYEKAKQEYINIIKKGKNEAARAVAQFNLGYLNVYYENPFADFNIALKEFKKFINQYPDHSKVAEASNYIRILDTIEKINKANKESQDMATDLSDEHADLVNNLISMQKAYLGCNKKVDSLKNRIKVLEAVIDEVDKIK